MPLLEKAKKEYKNLSNCIRILTADSVEKAGSGHPGMPLGMADVMTVLAFEFLKYNPKDSKWMERDRLVLSAGHGSMLLYAFYYLTGYSNFNIEDLKNLRQLGSKTPGHPEYGFYEAIETSTGPLGQGLANSVGMAIAAKKYALIEGGLDSYKIYCIVGDGCLMEGISYEAASLAGHLKLDNLIILFDNNKISIDGKTSLTVSEDHITKFQSMGFEAFEADGHNFEQISKALARAQNSLKPVFISFTTIIGKGTLKKAGSEESHGASLGKEEITYLKSTLGFIDEPFAIPDNLFEMWQGAWLKNKESYEKWHQTFNSLSNDQKDYLTKTKINNIEFLEQLTLNSQPQATRVASGHIIDLLVQNYDKAICGSADLSLSNNIKNKNCRIINSSDFSGNFIHYGVREHAMAAIMNGLALSGFLPVGGTFFVFSDYMKPAIRLAAIMKLRVIYIMTHDSIGVGGDGPTHQPVEHLAAMRALPNLLTLRPMDQLETKECWQLALQNESGPSMLILTRQNVPSIRRDNACENFCARGAYIIYGDLLLVEAIIFATGSEVAIALGVAEILEENLKICVVSLPSFELFFKQEKDYISKFINNDKIKIAIEAGSSFGWHQIIGPKGIFFGVEEYGDSAPPELVFELFGLSPEQIAEKLKTILKL